MNREQRTLTLERMLQIAEVLGVRVDGQIAVGQQS